MSEPQRVLVALSLTATDDPLLAYACMLARADIGRNFHFVHVHAGRPDDAPGSALAELEQCIDHLVSSHFRAMPDRVVVSRQVVCGERIDALLDCVTRSGADLILLGHRRSRRGQRSLARRLAMISPCSVWMVPEGSPLAITRILAPVDFSEHSADSLAVAATVAKAFGLEEVRALHVLFDDLLFHYEETIVEQRHNEQDAFSRFVAGIDTQGVRIEPCFEQSPQPALTIVQTAQDHRADLIVMNTRGRSRAAAILLGSVTSQVMVETTTPILVVKHFGAMMGLFETLRESHFWQRPNPKMN